MGRSPTPSTEKNGLKKGPWTSEEDEKLIDYIQKHGQGRWRTLPKNAGLKRCGKSCRLRWTNYLRPDIKRGKFSCVEEEAIIQLHKVMGNKWSAIAARLPGRTDNEIKNYWNTHIKKKLLRMGIDPVTHCPRLDLLELSSILASSLSMNISTSSQLNYVSNLLGQQLGSNFLITPQNLQHNQFQENLQACIGPTPSDAFNVINETQFMQPNLEQDSSNPTIFEPNLYQHDNVESLFNMPMPNYDYLNQETSDQSATTYVNCSTEDERDSYCSNMFYFNSLDVTNGLV